jgi:hypothetical protein
MKHDSASDERLVTLAQRAPGRPFPNSPAPTTKRRSSLPNPLRDRQAAEDEVPTGRPTSASTSFTTDAKFTTRMTRIVVTQRLRQRRRTNFLFLDEAPAA